MNSATTMAAPAPVALVPPAGERVDPARVVAFLAMCFGMFMAFLDIQVVSASLSEIQAGLAASSDEITWVQTSYLMAEVVAIPLSGFLSRALGTRIMFAGAAAGFTVASLMCGLSSTMGQMIVWRALQGFIGGGMVPTVFASAYTIFPRSRMPVITPLIGLVATLAPTIGPTVGGYLTDAFSWHWLFFINIVPGIVVTIAAMTLIDFDRPDFSLFESFDWFGLIFMALFLGALEYVLEDGPRYDWFEDSTIALAAVVSASAAVFFFARVLTARQPIVDLRTFCNRNFALGSMFSFVLGIGLYGLTYIYPVYLSQIRGHNALMVGETMFVSGATMFLSAPIVGRLVTRIDPRLMLTAGFAIVGLSNWEMSYLTRDWDFWQLFVPQVLRGFGMMLAIVPITNISLGTLASDRLKNASGLFNLTRNLGGAVGLAALNTVFDKRIDLHLARLHDAVTWARQPVLETLNGFAARIPGSDAQSVALKQLILFTRQQGIVMAFADVFLLLCFLFVTFAALVWFMRRPALIP
ncbi:MAG TPA: DHA2 family efflux MFS transporter permease subunit, partial [Xanthobacteraceae bacterium]|nr:DHA2 family efflux MFS transporter permease subunit [Xanthobacteraceae bacterium]